MKEGSIIFVRTDIKTGDEIVTDEMGMASAAYLQKLSEERYLVAGVFGDMKKGEVNGAMILFEAQDLEEAQQLSDEDPIIKSGLYRYELKQWNVMITPK